jgi:site-specific DNA-cytosine methylase
MKTYKLERDAKELVITQIEWLSELQCVKLEVEDVKSLYSKTKKQLIEIWVEKVNSLGHPNEKWLEIYY